VRVVAERAAWPEGRRLAGVSSFGFSGTNAHVVLEAAPAPAPEANGAVGGPGRRGWHVLALSAKSGPALRELAGRYAAWLGGRPGADLADVCYTANTGRAHFGHRAAVVAASADQARTRLEALARGEAPDGAVCGEPDGAPKVAFVFPGAGGEFAGLARELYAGQPVFRQALDRCAELWRGQGHGSLLEEIGSEGAAGEAAAFAVGYALAQLWQGWGVRPEAVLGHGAGAYVAACVAGVFSL
jgi:acyl transferase domain-containing protein